jgi:hypothetical protein
VTVQRVTPPEEIKGGMRQPFRNQRSGKVKRWSTNFSCTPEFTTRRLLDRSDRTPACQLRHNTRWPRQDTSPRELRHNGHSAKHERLKKYGPCLEHCWSLVMLRPNVGRWQAASVAQMYSVVPSEHVIKITAPRVLYQRQLAQNSALFVRQNEGTWDPQQSAFQVKAELFATMKSECMSGSECLKATEPALLVQVQTTATNAQDWALMLLALGANL